MTIRNWHRQAVLAREYSKEIIMHAEEHNQRTGQYLFNSFPSEVSTKITGKEWDPFYRSPSQDQIETWLKSHITFDDNGKIIRLVGDGKILWERNY